MGSNLNTLPDVYWHCSVVVGTGKKDAQRAVVNDLTREQLRVQIVEPWHKGTSFVVDGTIVKGRDGVSAIQIARTEQPQRYYAEEHNARMRASGIADFATERAYLPFGRGTDFTHDLLFKDLSGNAAAPDVALLLRLCQRLPEAARVLGNRKRSRPGFPLNDEYDAQDLLHAMVRSAFKYAVVEEPIGIVGGGPSSRADLALEDLGVLIELKFARGPADQDKMVKELAEDLLLYTKWAPLQTFIFVVVNAQDLRDPEALERLGGQTTVNGKSYRAHVVLA
jgi:hypothetical protein